MGHGGSGRIFLTARVVLAICGMVALGTLVALYIDSFEWLDAHGWVAFGVAAMIAVSVLAVNLWYGGGRAGSALFTSTQAAVGLSVHLMAFVVGLLLPYAAGVGGRDLANFSGDGEYEWYVLFAALAGGALLFGAAFGVLVGLLLHRWASWRTAHED